MLYAGIDAGGTKTKVRLADQSGRFVGEGSSGPANWQLVGEDGFLRAVREAWAAAGERARLSKDVRPVCVVAGVAGAGRDKEQEAVARALRREFPEAAVEAFSDAVVALAAGTLGEPGAVVIAGTGSMAWALGPNGATVRAGGWGYLLGDEGSGFFVGLEGIKAALRDHDGTGPATSLRSRLLHELRLRSPDDFVAFAYGGGVPRERTAALARAVLDEGKRGDAVASEIVGEAVAHLVRLCAAVIRRAEFTGSVPLVTAGGLFSDRRFRRLFVERLKGARPSVRPTRAVLDPAGGACALALKKGEKLDDVAKKVLLESFMQKDL